MTNLEKLIAESQWRPIEEAPKDGRRIMCKWKTHDPRSKDGCTSFITYWVDDERGEGWVCDNYSSVVPKNQEACVSFRALPDDRLAKCVEVLLGSNKYVSMRLAQVISGDYKVCGLLLEDVLEDALLHSNNALTECEKIAGQSNTIYVSESDYNKIVDDLNKPPKVIPELKKLFDKYKGQS